MQVLATRRIALGGLLGLMTTRWPLAKDYSAGKPGTIIVSLPAGSQTDSLARKLAELISERTHSLVNVENIPGASGAIAVNELLKRPRDGATLLLGSSGVICVTPLLMKGQIKFDPQVDLVPVCTTSTAIFFLLSGKNFPASSLRDMHRVFAGGREQLTYAANAVGSANHIAGEVVLQRLGIKGIHVPYNNTSQAIVDVAEGRVQLGIFGYSSIAPLLEADKVKLLCNLSNTPLEGLSKVKTVAAQGYGNFDIVGWNAIFVANGTPTLMIQEQERMMRSIFDNSEISSFINRIGAVPAFRSHEDSKSYVNDEIRRYREIIQKYDFVSM